MAFFRTNALASRYPGLYAVAWQADLLTSKPVELPPLSSSDLHTATAAIRSHNMTRFFRSLGTRGRSPVDFQIRKAREGTLTYSHQSAAVDYLLYLEVLTGFLVGIHDRDAVGDVLQYGLAEEVNEATFEHIAGSPCVTKEADPVLIANGRIIASLTHGPDYGTRITTSTRAVWGVIFGSPGESADELDRACEIARVDGQSRGIWQTPSLV